MAKRTYSSRGLCAEPGCSEWFHYEYDLKRDKVDADKRRQQRPWKCVRHTDKNSVLSPTNTKIVTEMVSGKSKRYPELDSLFFGESGFVFGRGWKAYAKDFPLGTKIIETVEVILPDSSINLTEVSGQSGKVE